jgi:hypothetical protein
MNTIEKLSYIKAIMFCLDLPKEKVDEVNKLFDEVLKELLHDTIRKAVYLRLPEPQFKSNEEIGIEYHTFFYENRELMLTNYENLSIAEILKRNNDIAENYIKSK